APGGYGRAPRRGGIVTVSPGQSRLQGACRCSGALEGSACGFTVGRSLRNAFASGKAIGTNRELLVVVSALLAARAITSNLRMKISASMAVSCTYEFKLNGNTR